MGPSAHVVPAWLLQGSDVAVSYQAHRDLLGQDRPDLRARIAGEGAGAVLIAARGADGHWGRGFYQPQWTSSHYTLLELKNLALPPDHPAATQTVDLILRSERGPDGGLNPAAALKNSDACINGMALGYAAYFGASEDDLAGVVDFLLGQRTPDGGFNCRLNRSGARHASLHTTTSVLEGFTEYLRGGYHHRRDKVVAARAAAAEVLLRHRLFRSHRTGEVIRPEFTRFHHPTRWYYDVLRGMDALLDAGTAPDPRMADAIALVRERRGRDGRWRRARAYPGESHLPPWPRGAPCPWVTLAATRVLAAYGSVSAVSVSSLA